MLLQDLPEDLEWKIIYVGSAESEEFDQVQPNTRHLHLTTCTSPPAPHRLATNTFTSSVGGYYKGQK